MYTIKKYKNKLKISIANFPIKMKLFFQKSRQNHSKVYNYEGVIFWQTCSLFGKLIIKTPDEFMEIRYQEKQLCADSARGI